MPASISPAWLLGHNPEYEIIAASYNISLPVGFSRRIRDLVRDPGYTALFAKSKLSDESQAVESWRTTAGGGYTAAGVGTGITGKGAHVLIIDDPIKDWEAADSASNREGCWEWYLSTAWTRVAPGGGILGIQCMTGDTPVLMADGTEQPLHGIRPGDRIASFEDGVLAESCVLKHKSCGLDEIYKITMASGAVVRANERHPFLVANSEGGLVWVQLKHLWSGQKIVTVKASGGSTKAKYVRTTSAASPLRAEDSARATTPDGSGLPGIARRLPQRARKLASLLSSGIATVSTWPSTTACWLRRTASALYVDYRQRSPTARNIGNKHSASTTITIPAPSEGCSATSVTSPSSGETLSKFYKPLSNTSDFTLDAIVSVEPDGIAEVFDITVERTENFIANGCCCHNTRWNDDDWAGRIILAMDSGDGEPFEVVSYPAINELGDEYLLEDDNIAQIAPGLDVPAGAQLLRTQNSALHPDRYNLDFLLRAKNNFVASGNTRMWSALYQQNPVPEEGAFFRKDMFKYITYMPETKGCNVYQAWDFSITEKEQSDWIVGYCLMQDSFDNVYELDMVRFKVDEDAFALADGILAFHQKWNPWVVGVEDGQIWKGVKAVVLRRAEELNVTLNYETLVPLTDKLVRAGPLRGRMQLGKVYFQQSAPFRDVVDNELLRFPAGKHDDIVDAMAWAMRLVLAHPPPAKLKPKKIKSWRDKLKFGAVSGSHMGA